MVGTDANSEIQKHFSHDPIHRQDLQTLASVNDLNFGWMERMRGVATAMIASLMHHGPAGVGRGQI